MQTLADAAAAAADEHDTTSGGGNGGATLDERLDRMLPADGAGASSNAALESRLDRIEEMMLKMIEAKPSPSKPSFNGPLPSYVTAYNQHSHRSAAQTPEHSYRQETTARRIEERLRASNDGSMLLEPTSKTPTRDAKSAVPGDAPYKYPGDRLLSA